MKRTCKTCDHFDCVGNCLCTDYNCPFKAHAIHREREAPACPAWKLDRHAFKSAFLDSLRKARTKHPVLLDVWPKAEDAFIYALGAKIWKRMIAKKTSFQLQAVLYSEVEEFLAEVARGDFERALEEAGDVVAVLYRALNGEGRTGDTGDSGDAGCASAGDGEEVRNE